MRSGGKRGSSGGEKKRTGLFRSRQQYPAGTGTACNTCQDKNDNDNNSNDGTANSGTVNSGTVNNNTTDNNNNNNRQPAKPGF